MPASADETTMLCPRLSWALEVEMGVTDLREQRSSFFGT